MDETLTPIEEFIVTGIQQRFQQVFGTFLLFTQTNDKKAEMARVKQKTGKDLEYPLAFAKYTALSLPTESNYSPTRMLRRGMIGQMTSDRVGTYKLGLIPVEISYDLEFVTPSMDHILKFGKQWLKAAAAGYLKFSVTYATVVLDIHMELDRRLTIPDRVADATEQPEYTLVTSFMCKGYMSDPELQSVQAVVEIDYAAFVAGKGERYEDTLAHASESQAFSFKNQWNQNFGPSGSTGE